MCGIAGFLSRRPAPGIESTARRMGMRLAHRGPDDSGVWCDPAAGVALAHRRLSILELTAAGHQPMTSASGRYVLTFNGEIYNHLALRAELEARGLARPWVGRSDTETLLAAFEAWPPAAALRRTVGMFALALWDRQERELVLARDRVGEKPLYFGWCGDSFLFASELKALRPHPDFDASVDRDALALYLRHNCVPAPRSIFRGISKLPAGGIARVAPDRPGVRDESYWSPLAAAQQARAARFRGGFDEAVSALDGLLRQAIAGQSVADVPVGAFLSGGVDSSLVVALMQAQSAEPVRTFTVGFGEADFNEAGHAAEVARRLGTRHEELFVSPREALALIPDLPSVFDEPFADTSQIPTHLVSRLARQSVRVSLSGDGGDELFGGYQRYRRAARLTALLRGCPGPLRGALARMLGGRMARAAVSRLWRLSDPGERLQRLASLMSDSRAAAVYRAFASHWDPPALLVRGAQEPSTPLDAAAEALAGAGIAERMMLIDLVTYLPDDILVKLDRASMAVSLETRVPFLDHRIVEFAWSLPLPFRVDARTGKRPLRRLLERHLPAQLFERRKQGFVVPIDAWLRGPLRPWAEALLADRRLREEGYLDADIVRRAWREHLSGARNHGHRLWGVLMFAAWLESLAPVPGAV
ncbi:MAG TPA: asparagine synthase (glutamine-hydrolyzing) [Steroidobacteraceae bacterium]|jgi:asparagine synthase (glutamine-hydrolysing)